MKKLAIPLLAGLVALGTLVLAQPAGAATSTASFGPTPGLTAFNASAGTVSQQEHAANKLWKKDGKPVYYLPTGAGHAYVQCDDTFLFACVLFTIHLDHADVSSAAYDYGLGLAANMATLACAAVPDPVAAFGCAVSILALAAVTDYAMVVARNQVTYAVAWGCGVGQWLCWPLGTPGAIWNNILQEWEVPEYWTGLNIEMTFLGAPVGWALAYNG